LDKMRAGWPRRRKREKRWEPEDSDTCMASMHSIGEPGDGRDNFEPD